MAYEFLNVQLSTGCCGGRAEYMDNEGGECLPRSGSTIQGIKWQGVNIADQNHLALKYERTMYSASYQSAERGYFVHSYIQITFPGPAQYNKRHVKPVKARTFSILF